MKRYENTQKKKESGAIMGKLGFRKRPSGKWSYYFEGASIDGKRKKIEKGGFRTKAEALVAGTKALNEYNTCGVTFNPTEISVADYLDYWLENYCKVNFKESTVRSYEKHIRINIKPALGQYKLKSLTPASIQQLIYDKFNSGMSRNSLAIIKGILTSSLKYAVEPLKYIQSSPAIYIKMPLPRAKPEIPTKSAPHIALTKEQMNIIFERFSEDSSDYIAMQLGYRCGLRIGEAFAVTFDDIDFKEKTLTVNHQVQWTTNKKWQLISPKYDSVRIVKLDDYTLKILNKKLVRQEQAKQFYAGHYTYLYVNNNGIINTDGDGQVWNSVNVRENGTYIQARTMQHTSHIIRTQLGIEGFDFHSLRHTHATRLAAAGVHSKDLQVRLGHKNVETTLKYYVQDTEEMQQQTVQKILDVL